MKLPRLTIAGLGGDTGKTAFSVGLCRFWRKKGYSVIPFKKGPDYIDMGWLSRAAKSPCYNLDLFLMNKQQSISSFISHSESHDIAVIEGNRGLFDGLDIEGSVSTAELAKLLLSPVILIVDCTKVTRTVAALVLGCQNFDTAVTIKGVILNKLAGVRHESIIRKSIEQYCNLPVVGALPKLPNSNFPGRHLGLVPPQEHPQSESAIENAAEVVGQYIDTEQLWRIAQEAPRLSHKPALRHAHKNKYLSIGVIHDSAFQFYYPENLEALQGAGARLIEFSALTDNLPKDISALYIGGGFPETHAASLSANKKLRDSIRHAADEGLPIYAECGGLMYLSDELVWDEKIYPMVGVFPLSVGVSKKPKGHGYTVGKVEKETPYYQTGEVLKGHEFHYSHVLNMGAKNGVYFAMTVNRGAGILKKNDGLCYKNVFATYVHVHALGTPKWACGIMKAAKLFKQKNLSVN